MAIQFIDGFTHYATDDLLKKWDLQALCNILSTRQRRYGVKHLTVGSGLFQGYSYKNFSSFGPTLIHGFAFNTSGGINNIRWNSDEGLQIEVVLNVNGSVSIACGAVNETTDSEIVLNNTWQHFEMKVLLHNSAGTYEIRINEVNVLSDSGVDTLSQASAELTQLQFHQPPLSGSIDIHDLFVLDDTGGVNDDFLGDCRIDTLLPDANGTYSQFTPSAGSNWENVDDLVAVGGDIDDDATHNESSFVGHKDTYNVDDIPALGTTIFGVAANSCIRKTDAGIRYFKQLTITESEHSSEEKEMTDFYKVYQKIMDVNPHDSAAFEEADIDAIESGVLITL